MEEREYNLEEWNPIWTHTPTGRRWKVTGQDRPVTGAQPVNPHLVLEQDLVDRQGVDLSVPLAVGLAGGLAILTFQLFLPLLAPLLTSGTLIPTVQT